MAEWSLWLAPVALLILVIVFGFAGCTFVPGVTDPDFVSEWMLGEAPGATEAADTKSANEGTYKSITLAENAPSQSPPTASPPVLNLGAPGLREAFPTETSMQVDGGYVEVPFDPSLNPSPAFSILAWVHPEWDAGELVGGRKPFRCVAVSREVNSVGGEPKGYVLYAGPKLGNATDMNVYWQAWVANGVEWTMLVADANPVELNQTTHLAMTYDGTVLKLYINGANDEAGSPAAQVNAQYAPNTSRPFFIGMGAPEQPAPLFPFKGRIQQVLLYQKAVDSTTVDGVVMTSQVIITP